MPFLSRFRKPAAKDHSAVPVSVHPQHPVGWTTLEQYMGAFEEDALTPADAITARDRSEEVRHDS
jgi:hypothetical protein